MAAHDALMTSYGIQEYRLPLDFSTKSNEHQNNIDRNAIGALPT